ncbi:MAG: sigma 54-interacting transcriptional regulator [Melioribacteraceae bacterium]|nr:sigma 54-interacting transcriptional regulator [Melioribacteraceae bacterium]
MAFNKNFTDDILDSLGEGVFTVDKNFKIKFFNKAAEKITGHKRDEVIGKFCKHIFRSDLCFHDCPIAKVLQTKKNIYDFETNIQSKAKDTIPIKLNSAVLYNENEEPVGGVISFKDLCDVESLKFSLKKEADYHGIIGRSKQIREIFDLIDEISDSDASVLIHGQSGTGKELVANAIQKTCHRKDKPFIKINCSVFPDNLLASELFGHVKGAFTDAVKDRPGRFEIADGGTIFLDEVAEMPLQMQVKLLRVLQEGSFERVGESVTRKADVRVIAATNIDIQEALKNGTFREDLYYRLNVIPIEVPPLSARMDDLIPLINHFLSKYSILYNKEIKEVDEETIETLSSYDWPGNIRELENVIEYAFVRANKEKSISKDKLPLILRNNKAKFVPQTNFIRSSDFDKNEMIEILKRNKWNKTAVAKELGIGRTTLWRKLKTLGLVE